MALYTWAMELALIAFLLAAGIWTYQAFVWLQTGLWPDYPLYLLVFWLFGNHLSHTWLLEPRSWLGAHKIITGLLFFPISAYLFGYSILRVCVWSLSQPRSVRKR